MPVELSRTVRFCLAPDGSLDADAPVDNSFSAWPPMRGLGRYLELTVTCLGEPDPVTGYFMNIKRIDHAVRHAALPIIAAAASGSDSARSQRLGDLLTAIMPAIDAHLAPHRIASVRLALTPYAAIAMQRNDPATVLVSQQFEFAAAHRLHAPALCDADNRATFGKCNNPAGHGHNYRLRVTVRCPADRLDSGGVPIAALDALVNRIVIENLDHKNLDTDVPALAGANSSVENIARAIHAMLADEIPALGDGAPGIALDEVTVWETEKTSCTFRG